MFNIKDYSKELIYRKAKLQQLLPIIEASNLFFDEKRINDFAYVYFLTEYGIALLYGAEFKTAEALGNDTAEKISDLFGLSFKDIKRNIQLRLSRLEYGFTVLKRETIHSMFGIEQDQEGNYLMKSCGGVIESIDITSIINIKMTSITRNISRDTEIVEKRLIRNKEIEIDVAAGLSATDISKNRGISLGTVYKVIKNNSIKTEKDSKTSLILKMRKNGAELKEISKATNLSIGRISKILKKENLDIKNERDAKIEEMERLGYSAEEIAAKFSLSVNTIKRVLKKSQDRIQQHREETTDWNKYHKEQAIKLEMRNQEISEMYSNGVSIKELSEHFNLTEKLIREICA